MKKFIKYIKIASFVGLVVFVACSTEKNTFFTRAYHNITAHYNVFFNGREAYRKGIARVKNNIEFNFTQRLPVYIIGGEDAARSASSSMDKAIEKASKTIKLHSITADPKVKDGRLTDKQRKFLEKNEYNKWVDDSYFLMGRAYFVKNDFLKAQNNFKYILRQFPNNPIRFKAMIWLGRTSLEQDNLQKTKEWIDQIDADDDFPEDLEKEFEVLNAAYYLKLNSPDRAIPHLEKAIELNKDKDERLRHKYIIAQLYKKQDNFEKAANYFEHVQKKSNNYEMEFNAIINMAECYGKLGSSYEDMKKLLTKMLKDDKNTEYLDQIYYALGEVEYKNNNTEEAIKNYKLSSAKSVNNNNQKAVSCLRLGDIYYKQKDYKLSQAYYDTCILNLSNQHPRYEDLNQLSSDLNKLVKNINTVERQDSLQMIASMDKKERNELIDKMIKKVIEEEKKKKEQERQQRRNSMLFDQQRNRRGGRVNAPGGGKWYFYNPSTLSFGANEFQKKWGKREMEDHWRRSNKKSLASDDITASDTASADSAQNKNRITDKKSKEYYLQDLPLNDSLIAVSDNKIKEALFKMGKIYMDDFQDWDKSIKAYETLNERFPEHEYKLLTWYNLYKLHKKKNNNSKADEYKQKLINKFPDSNYAKMLENPNYVKELQQRREKQKSAYNDIYEDYRKGNIVAARKQADDFLSKYPESEIRDKVEFIKILTDALNVERLQFKKNLAGFINNYPESRLTNRAAKILGFLGESNIDSLLTNLEKRPDVEPEKEITDTLSKEKSLIKQAEKIYNYNPDTTHYYMIVSNSNKIDTKKLRFEISNFNIFTFNITTFRVLYSLYDENTELIYVKSFKTRLQAFNYMKLIKNNQNVFGKLDSDDYSQYIISLENFETLKSKKELKKYRAFYQKHYLK